MGLLQEAQPASHRLRFSAPERLRVSFPRHNLEALILGSGEQDLRRFTQDSPVVPDVWLEYAKPPESGQERTVDLLLAAHEQSNPQALAQKLRKRLRGKAKKTSARIAYTESFVAARLTLSDLVCGALPLSEWWLTYIQPSKDDQEAGLPLQGLVEKSTSVTELTRRNRNDGHLLWLTRLVGALALAQESTEMETELPPQEVLATKGESLIKARKKPGPHPYVLWQVSRNRNAYVALWRSRRATKADAATRLFELDCRHLRWAVIDSGIDATHPAFRRRDSAGGLRDLQGPQDASWNTRVVATYDFTRLRDLIHTDREPEKGLTDRSGLALPPNPDAQKEFQELRRNLSHDRRVDWSLFESVLRVRHEKSSDGYQRPTDDHGTRVAGILAGDWRTSDNSKQRGDLIGMCPTIELYDLRVLNKQGEGEEFHILAALQFVRYLNRQRDRRTIHGVNLSLSLRHEVKAYACGRTPVCDEANRLVDSGTVVVAAAGNEGHFEYPTPHGYSDGYRAISITDPGNADSVLTVGATHRMQPHTYGVSYFSGRGPTGDGRPKPDLVAPGEKVTAPSLKDSALSFDGTSAAAPHVSGAAALLLARHPEFIGRPAVVKRALCDTATDLGRERSFQGHGMVDVLRALQSV